MKKSTKLRPLTIGLIGMSAFALAACKEETAEVSVWRADQGTSCEASTGATTAECETMIADAKAQHQEAAPRYDALAVCEEQHGAGNCESQAAPSGGGGSIFMPILMGYMMGKMMSGGFGGGAGAAASKPLYPTAGGQMSTADGGAKFNAGQNRASVPTKAFAASPSTVGKPPMSAAQVRSSGGFGERAQGGSSGAARTSSGG